MVNDWQLSGIFTGNSGTPYTIGYTYQNGGGNVNLTGSPDYPAAIRIVGDPGSGCSSDQYTPVQHGGLRWPAAPAASDSNPAATT